ncbi:cell wall-active antibiotics response protein LiaF [Cohnella nanjingensis]|uniref:Cell wall-active antibiotics response protein n=1 Tax=Cohnella nanjingensis TaxID=1387779 RepID=A0A7X0VD72_9BACL|nr:cell wall-active antibiotics response protein LiaF [Cohnella nanjingensis]MBB6669670.1 cell wall-active antibiotics response protein [Cohnella nanjingensis]
MQQSVLHRIFWGIVLIGIGVIYFLNQTGTITIDIGDLFKNFWPVIIILVGVQGLLLQRQGGYWWNPIVVLVGVFFLGRNLEWFDWEFGDLIRVAVPFIMIFFGIMLVTRGARHKPDRKGKSWETKGWDAVTPPYTPPKPPEPNYPPPPPPAPYDHPNAFGEPSAPGPDGSVPPQPNGQSGPNDYRPNDPQSYRQKVRQEAERMWKDYHRMPGHKWGGQREGHSRFIGDLHIGHDYWELKPMSLSHFIGDTTIDLTRAQIPAGETRIYVSSFIGDVKVFVPNDFSIGIRVVSSCLIGDVKVLEQHRGGIFNQMAVETPSFPDTDRQVVLIVNTFIGDVRVTKVG